MNQAQVQIAGGSLAAGTAIGAVTGGIKGALIGAAVGGIVGVGLAAGGLYLLALIATPTVNRINAVGQPRQPLVVRR